MLLLICQDVLSEAGNAYIRRTCSWAENKGASVCIKVGKPGLGVWYSIALHSCDTEAQVALGEDSDAIVMTVIAEKLGENGSLDKAFCTREYAD